MDSDSRAAPFDSRLLPALQAVAVSAKPFLTYWPLLAVGLSVLHVFWAPFASSQPTSFGIVPLAGIAYLGSALAFLRLGHGDAGEAAAAAGEPTPFTRLILALRGLVAPLETCLKVSFLIALALNTPFGHEQPSAHLIFQPWAYVLLAAGLATAGLLAPPRVVSGAARFAYLRHSGDFTRHYKLLLTGWAYAAFALPAIYPAAFTLVTAGLIFVSVRAGLAVHGQHRVLVREIADAAAEITSKAHTGAAYSEARLLVGERHEQQLLAAAAAAQRDAIRAHSVKATDFFDCATAAWAAIGTVVTPTNRAMERTRELLEAVQDVADAEKPEDEEELDGIAEFVVEQAKKALEEGNAVLHGLYSAQEAVRTCETAANQRQKARQLALVFATDAAAAASEVGQTLKGCAERVSQAARSAKRVTYTAAKATETAIEGDIDTAMGLLEEAENAAKDVEETRAAITIAVAGAHQVLLEFLRKLHASP